eukprot:CAMPEP_0184685402 /NCGR_PEP_ID=MMETSP0312-20130426/18864_1 /TAXON_ID=31354 /ORGANISM="Compsopogon coeruleus, Strain SAG 36.94" /LENGTH=397 /DNA_ID=CAMNT_0027139477 /DNA_START=124 /DNA_END=1314 /DNA_ORIENTATION=+
MARFKSESVEQQDRLSFFSGSLLLAPLRGLIRGQFENFKSKSRPFQAFGLVCMAIGVLCFSAWSLITLRPSDSLLDSPSKSHTPHGFQSTSVNLSVILDAKTYDYPFSLFLAGTLTRFGSGSVSYHNIRVNFENDTEAPNSIASPCLVAGRRLKPLMEWKEKFASHCKVFLTSDEFCDGAGVSGIHVRQYDGANMDREKVQAAYIPLGPRLDFWAAFANMSAAKRTILPPSKRNIIYNAIFSKSTSESRKQLAELLNSSEAFPYSSRAVLKIADEWSQQLSEEHMGPAEYAATLMDTIFTLSPTGHHPECYRMFEAIEAGSIPVIALDEEYRRHKCSDSLRIMRMTGAPIVFVSDWRHLFVTMRYLLSDLKSLDRRQGELTKWYNRFMSGRVRAFES